MGAVGIRNIRHPPGLVVIPSDDPFLAAERTAQSCGAEVARLEGWPLQVPKRDAEVLSQFWASRLSRRRRVLADHIHPSA